MRSLVCQVLLLFMLGSSQLWAQSTQYTPQAPNTAALGRFGDQPANLFTGVPTITIPIYDIAAGPVQVPVNLAYHAGGYRVNEMASWVGLGWALNAGGSITRTKVGSYDEQVDHGVLYKPLNLTINTTRHSPPEDPVDCDRRVAVLNDYINGALDRGYDIFSFSLPNGKSGKFILKPDSSTSPVSMVTLLVYERVKITYAYSASTQLTFSIVDEDGVTYLFNQIEWGNIAGDNQGSLKFPSAWLPTEIRGTRPTERVQFTYTNTEYDGYSDYFDRVQLQTYSSGCADNYPVDTHTFDVTSRYSTPLLSSIIFPGGKLVFQADVNTRTDAATGAPKLNTIELYGLQNSAPATYQLIKQFSLGHSYFPLIDNLHNASFTTGPLNLASVVMRGADGKAIGQYTADYNTATPLPGFQSRMRDLWGYYNHKTQNDSPGNGSLPSLVPRTLLSTCVGANCSSDYYGTANRDPDETYMKACILTKLTYPTCGYTKYTYEINAYQDANGVHQAGGLRIARIETQASDGTSPGQIRVKTYKYGVNESGYGDANVFLYEKFWTGQITYTEGDGITYLCRRTITALYSFYTGVLTPYDGSPVTYPTVTEYEGSSDGTTVTQNTNGRTVYTFTTYGDVLHVHPASWALSYVVSNYWRRGQLKTKTVYAQTNTQLYTLTNTWIYPKDSLVNYTGILLDQLQDIKAYQGLITNPTPCARLDFYTQPQYVLFPQGNTRLAKTVETTYSQDGSASVPTSTTTTYNANYQAQEKYLIASDGSITARHYTYPHDFAIPASPQGPVKAIKLLQDNNQRNTVLEEYGYKIPPSTAPNQAPILTDGKLTVFQESSNLPGYAFASETKELQVLGGGYTKAGFVPLSLAGTSALSFSPNYTTAMTITDYDANINPLQYTERNGLTTRLDWLSLTGSNGNPFSVVQKQTVNYGTSNSLDTQFSYDVPLLGVQSMTDPNGNTTRYAYDSFGRLDAIRDQANNLVQSFDYNLKCQTDISTLKQLTVNAPDLTPIVHLTPGLASGTTSVSLVVDVYEIASVTTSGLISMRISKDSRITLSLNPSATQVAGRPVQNSVWTLSGPSGGYYTLTTAQPIQAGDLLSVGLTGTLNPGATKGSLTITNTIVGGSGGENDFTNNADGDKIEYTPNP